MRSFEGLIKFILTQILYKGGEGFDSDNLAIKFYDDKIVFQINEVFDGPMIIFYKSTGLIKIEADYEIDEIPFTQTAELVKVLQKNKHILNNLI